MITHSQPQKPRAALCQRAHGAQPLWPCSPKNSAPMETEESGACSCSDQCRLGAFSEPALPVLTRRVEAQHRQTPAPTAALGSLDRSSARERPLSLGLGLKWPKHEGGGQQLLWEQSGKLPPEVTLQGSCKVRGRVRTRRQTGCSCPWAQSRCSVGGFGVWSFCPAVCRTGGSDRRRAASLHLPAPPSRDLTLH